MLVPVPHSEVFRVLFHTFPGPQIELALEACDRPQETKSTHISREVQNGITTDNNLSSLSRRLDVVGGSPGCIFAHPHFRTLPKISEICSCPDPFTVPESPIQSLYISQGLHQGADCDFIPPF